MKMLRLLPSLLLMPLATGCIANRMRVEVDGELFGETEETEFFGRGIARSYEPEEVDVDDWKVSSDDDWTIHFWFDDPGLLKDLDEGMFGSGDGEVGPLGIRSLTGPTSQSVTRYDYEVLQASEGKVVVDATVEFYGGFTLQADIKIKGFRGDDAGGSEGTYPDRYTYSVR